MYPHIDSVGNLNQLYIIETRLSIMERNNQCTRPTTTDTSAIIEQLMKLGIPTEFFGKIIPMMDSKASMETNKTIANLITKTAEEMNIQAIESTLLKDADIDMVSLAIERLQKDIATKKLEQKFEEENRNLFRTTGSALVWRPVYLYATGMLQGGALAWRKDVLKAICDSLTSDEPAKANAARLSMKLTEARIRCNSDITEAGKSMIPLLTDITTIAKDILNIEKPTSVNGYDQLKKTIDTIDAWVCINF